MARPPTFAKLTRAMPEVASEEQVRTNGRPPGFVSRFRDLLRSHVELGLLEYRFEVAEGTRRLISLGAGVFLAATAYVFLQVAILRGVGALGLPIGGAALVLAGLYGTGAYVIIAFRARRNRGVPSAFEGSRQEWRRTREWIQKRFS